MKTEHEIQNKIRRALVDRCILWRANVGRRKMADGRWFDTGLPKGFPDLFGVCVDTGRFVGIEVKRPGGKVSPEQVGMITAIRAAGGLAGVACSVQDALDILDESYR